MIIANPIYDVVFKYLLEDIEIAREFPRNAQNRSVNEEKTVKKIYKQIPKKPDKFVHQIKKNKKKSCEKQIFD